MEIIYDLLNIINDNNNRIKVTPLLRFSNVSPQSFSSYYLELLEKELIAEEVDGKDNKYVTLTNRGIQYLREYKVVLRFIEEFEL
jgi:predicted transcriptional regulator